MSLHDAQHNFIKSVEKGIMKVMSKMGIATLDSYCGAQVFEALGLSERLIHEAFPGTPDFRTGGIGFTDLAEDVLAWHRNAFPRASGDATGASGEPKLDGYGFYKVRRGGEYHAYNPEVVRALHEVVGLAKPTKDDRRRTTDDGRAQLPASSFQLPTSSLQPLVTTAYRRYADLVQSRPPGRAARPTTHRHGPAAADLARSGRVSSGHFAPLLERRDVAWRARRGGA